MRAEREGEFKRNRARFLISKSSYCVIPIALLKVLRWQSRPESLLWGN